MTRASEATRGEDVQPVEMALEAAAIVMRNGGSTVAANRTFTNILRGYKKEGVAAAWRLDFIVATVPKKAGRPRSCGRSGQSEST